MEKFWVTISLLVWVVSLSWAYIKEITDPGSLGDQIGLAFVFVVYPVSFVFAGIGLWLAARKGNHRWKVISIAMMLFPFIFLPLDAIVGWIWGVLT